MKKPAFLTARCIRWTRCARPAIDCGLLLLSLFLFMHFDNISMENQMEKNRSKQIEDALQVAQKQMETQHKPVSIVQQFSNETDMWDAFANWLQATGTASGNCRIETRPEMDQTPYSLQCAGSSNTKNNRPEKNPSPITLFASNVLVAPEKISRPANHDNDTLKQPAAENKTVHVSGWINTPSGRRHFDPVSKKWLR